ncbi:MAG: toprim domain-containing protein [Verrucomicrobiales bacterium]
MAELADRLAQDEVLCHSLASSRGWEAPTISALANTRSLGWLDGDGKADGYICFLYPNSVKTRALWRDGGPWRWSRPDGTRHIRWHWNGWPWNKLEVWRENKLGDPMRGRTIVVEGETDAISLIDRGANDYETDVVALPDAGIISALADRLPSIFRGLDVILCPDTDAAGQRAQASFIAAVRPAARTLEVVNHE